ncbi:unnamed protein product, partial [Prorocentrum cordatum]
RRPRSTASLPGWPPSTARPPGPATSSPSCLGRPRLRRGPWQRPSSRRRWPAWAARAARAGSSPSWPAAAPRRAAWPRSWRRSSSAGWARALEARGARAPDLAPRPGHGAVHPHSEGGRPSQGCPAHPCPLGPSLAAFAGQPRS